MLTLSLSLSCFFLLQVFSLAVLSQIYRKSHKFLTLQILQEHPFLFFYLPFYDFFFKPSSKRDIFTSCFFAKNISRFGFGASTLVFITTLSKMSLSSTALAFIMLAFVLVYISFSDFIPRLLGQKSARKVFISGGLISSTYLCVIFPITFFFLKITEYNLNKQTSSNEHIDSNKEKIYELIQETLPDKNLEASDKLLIESILHFKQRIVREVMVPRMDVFALSENTSIKEAVKFLEEDNYSRIPVYKDSLDDVTGILLHKDLFNSYIRAVESSQLELLNQPIKTLITKALYTPETRKISHLLQEFLQKQQHLALVVDEFGAIEGVITIEDLLEEIVGEISDEYDEDEDQDFFTEQQDSWVVDARVSLFDIEQKCHVKIPRLGDYDTVAGYIIHRSGSIPSPNLKIDHDNFELEVLSTTERQIKQVRITPRKTTSK